MLKLQLVRDGEIIFEMPLSPMDWPMEQLENEFKSLEEDFHRVSKIFNVLSSETRLRMMRRIMAKEDRTMSFTGFMRELDLNPKIVWENSRKLSDGGLLKKTGKGRYSCSDFGQTTFMVMSLALQRLIAFLEETENF